MEVKTVDSGQRVQVQIPPPPCSLTSSRSLASLSFYFPLCKMGLLMVLMSLASSPVK